MKRSEINALMREAVTFFEEHRFQLPPFAFWSPAEWEEKGDEVDEIRSCRLGWDLTDFGTERFRELGLLLFTVRNGNLADPTNAKGYAEKIMIVEEGQVTPWHFHGSKMADLIKRGGGKLVIELCNSNEAKELLDTEVMVSTDGVRRTVEPRGRVTLSPGESISLCQGLAHTFYGEEGKVLVGEVSAVNDDETDNYFIDPVGRFPKIEEDEVPLYLLCNEYP